MLEPCADRRPASRRSSCRPQSRSPAAGRAATATPHPGRRGWLALPLLLAATWALLSTAPVAAQTGAADGQAADDPAPAATVRMTADLTFDPASVTIQAGETVEWVNVSPNDRHSVTLDFQEVWKEELLHLPDGAATFNSGIIDPGGRYTRTFEAPGRYAYACVPHQAGDMAGEVIVEPASDGD